MTTTARVAAVVVTHNRKDLLAEALTAVLRQTRPPDTVVVVDNASTDGTAEFVRERFRSAELIELHTNTGGAGGFAVGIAQVLRTDAEVLWLLDDDTIPRPEALQSLLSGRAGMLDRPPVLVASRVVWIDGRDHPMNTPRRRPGAGRAESAAAAAVNCVPIRSASFVSVLVDAASVRESGLPAAAYFLWNDDFEFTARLLRERRGVLCRDSVVVHKTRTYGDSRIDPGERFYFEVRNKIWLFTRSRCLAPGERILYAGSTLRRWIRTFAVSADRATLRKGLRRGLIAGFFSSPAPTTRLLAEWGAGQEPRRTGT